MKIPGSEKRRIPYTEGIEQITNSFTLDALPVLAVDSFGGVHIAWEGSFGSKTTGRSHHSAFYSHNKSGSFISIQIELPTGYASFSVAGSRFGRISHIGFTRRGIDRSNIWCCHLYINRRQSDLRKPSGRQGGAPEVSLDAVYRSWKHWNCTYCLW